MSDRNYRKLVTTLFSNPKILGDGIGRHALFIDNDRPTFYLFNSWVEANRAGKTYEKETPPEKFRPWNVIDLEQMLGEYQNAMTKVF